MKTYEILEQEAGMRAFVRETGERIEMLESCLDDLAAKLARICRADVSDQRVMRGLLDQTRMVTSTIRGYDKLMEMRMNMQAHRDAGIRHIEKLKLEQTPEELAEGAPVAAKASNTPKSNVVDAAIRENTKKNIRMCQKKSLQRLKKRKPSSVRAKER